MGYHNRGNFGSGFAVGTIVGMIAAGMIFKNRKRIMVKMWQLKARADVHRRVRELTDITRDKYDAIVDDVMARYRTTKHIAAYEIDMLADELKGRWESVKHQFEEAAEEAKDEFL